MGNWLVVPIRGICVYKYTTIEAIIGASSFTLVYYVCVVSWYPWPLVSQSMILFFVSFLHNFFFFFFLFTVVEDLVRAASEYIINGLIFSEHFDRKYHFIKHYQSYIKVNEHVCISRNEKELCFFNSRSRNWK